MRLPGTSPIETGRCPPRLAEFWPSSPSPCQTLEVFDRNRQLLIDIGFNSAALPDARHDLPPSTSEAPPST